MKRRSFLGFLLAAPFAAPAVASAIEVIPAETPAGGSAFTFTADKLSIRGGLIADGTTTATKIRSASITSYTGVIDTLHVGSLKIR